MTPDGSGQGVGVSFQQVQKYEKGTNRVSASKLFEMAEFMQVGIPFFFEDSIGLSRVSPRRPLQASSTTSPPPNTAQKSRALRPAFLRARQKAVVQIMREMLDEGAVNDA